MRRVLAALAVLACPASPAFAQTIVGDASLAARDRLITHIDLDGMKAIVAAEGHTIDSVNDDPLEPWVVGKTADGLLFVLKGEACEVEDYEDCLGLNVQVRYDADDSVTGDKINLANATYAAIKVARFDNEAGADTAFVGHYAILDGGQTMGNLRTILVNVLVIAPEVRAILWPSDQ